jgi:hypothetical protein
MSSPARPRRAARPRRDPELHTEKILAALDAILAELDAEHPFFDAERRDWLKTAHADAESRIRLWTAVRDTTGSLLAMVPVAGSVN